MSCCFKKETDNLKYDLKTASTFDITNTLDMGCEAVAVVPPVLGSTPETSFPEM
jgi:hypothetical protein